MSYTTNKVNITIPTMEIIVSTIAFPKKILMRLTIMIPTNPIAKILDIFVKSTFVKYPYSPKIPNIKAATPNTNKIDGNEKRTKI